MSYQLLRSSIPFKRKGLLIAVAIAAFCAVLSTAVVTGGQSDDAHAVKLESGRALPSMLQSIALDDYGLYGLNGVSGLADLSIGQAYRIYTIDIDMLVAGNTDFEQIYRPTSMWYVELLALGGPACLITVEKIDGEYRAVALGARVLAQELYGINEELVTKGQANPMFLRVYQATSDFLITGELPASGSLIPLVSARISLGISEPANSDFVAVGWHELLPKLSDAIARNIHSQNDRTGVK